MKRVPKKWLDYTAWTVEQHAEHLRTDPTYLAYFAKFNAESVEKFITEYASKKHNSYTTEAFFKQSYESYKTYFLSHADRYIDQILQKKLFNLQCQWRACLIELPLVDIIDDFEYWSLDNCIRACPFIPPITEDEIDLCIRFLLEDMDFGHCNNAYIEDFFQDYDKFKNQLFVDEHEGTPEAEAVSRRSCAEMPNLYHFFDTFQGTTHLINLPNIRGEKERPFEDKGQSLRYEEREKELKEKGMYKEPKRPNLDAEGRPLTDADKPSLYTHNADEFIEQAEDERTKDMLKAYEHYKKRNHNLNYDGLDEDIEVLKEFDEPIPIDALSDWRIAVRLAAARFRQKKAAEMLPYAYDSYLLEFDEGEDVEQIIAQRVAHVKYNNQYNIYDQLLRCKKEFLNGREALTGKRDFDYLND